MDVYMALAIALGCGLLVAVGGIGYLIATDTFDNYK